MGEFRVRFSAGPQDARFFKKAVQNFIKPAHVFYGHPKSVNKENEPLGMSLENFLGVCSRGLRQDSGQIIESGSAFHRIVNTLIHYYGMKPEEAIKTALSLEQEAGFKRS